MVPLAAGAIVLASGTRPALFRPPHKLLDAALAGCLLVPVIQLIPLQPSTRQALSPAASSVEGALLFDAGDVARPLSLDPAATTWALATGLAVVACFWTARSIFARGGGLRQVARGVAWYGLVLAAIMFVQRATTPSLIYGFWHPITRSSNPAPLGPFVNRNDFATWLLLACPLVFGYALARIESRAAERHTPAGFEVLADSRTVWLGASVCLMIGALLASVSRSGLFGGAAAVAMFAVAARQRLTRQGVGVVFMGLALLIAIGAAYANLTELMQRISATVPSNFGGRITVWRETLPMARDFLNTGLGVGAFERGMLYYQTTTRLIFINHAHNEYLQFVVEGGLLLAVPLVIVIGAGSAAAARRLAEDTTPVFWIRAGAVSGIAAVAAQGIWDTGLRMPANAVLFAIVAAAATFSARSERTTRLGGPPLPPARP